MVTQRHSKRVKTRVFRWFRVIQEAMLANNGVRCGFIIKVNLTDPKGVCVTFVKGVCVSLSKTLKGVCVSESAHNPQAARRPIQPKLDVVFFPGGPNVCELSRC